VWGGRLEGGVKGGWVRRGQKAGGRGEGGSE